MKTPDEIKKARKVVDTIKEAFAVFEAMELPMEERECTLSYDAAMALVDGFEELERERDALLADLTLACAEVLNPCRVCGHYRTDWPKPGCELGGLTCAWCWRGVQSRGK